MQARTFARAQRVRCETPAPTTNTFDAAGNILSNGTATAFATFTYSDRGRMSSAKVAANTVKYLYNGLDQRVQKSGPTAVVPSGQAIYTYDEDGKLLGEYAATQVANYETVYLGSTPVAVITQKRTGTSPNFVFASTMNYAYADQIDTVRVITRASDNKMVWRWDQADPFGVAAANESPFALPVFKYGPRFPGQVYDVETNLHYNYYRDYDPQTGRYVQSDPIGLQGGINTFGYVGGNPLTYVDPEGLLGMADMPTLPQGVVDFSAGMGDVILFGFGQNLRNVLSINGGVNQCSSEYSAGEWAGIAASLATGLNGGLKAAGVKGAKGSGIEFSHWIPNRMGGPRSIWNGNFVTKITHALSDPYRYRFMPRTWKEVNVPMGTLMAQWTRIPNAHKGAASGAAYGAGGASQAGCECKR